MINREKIIKFLHISISVIVLFAFMILGFAFQPEGIWTYILMLFAFLIPLVTLIIGHASNIKYARILRYMDEDDSLLNQNADPTDIVAKETTILKRIIVASDVYEGIVFLCGCALAFGGGAHLKLLIALIPAFMYIYSGVSTLRFLYFAIADISPEGAIKEAEYPLLYKLAYKAARQLSCKRKITIILDHDEGASISESVYGYLLFLGTYVIDNLTEDELYNIMLNQFSYATEEKKDNNEFIHYYKWLKRPGLDVYEIICSLPVSFFEGIYTFEYVKYKNAISVINRKSTDATMAKYGDPRVAASALVKMKFFDMYQWELQTYERENMYVDAKMRDDYVRRELADFKESEKLRRDEWIKIINSEIPYRNTTHSTIKMRIEALGVNVSDAESGNDSEQYRSEIDGLILQFEKGFIKEYSSRYQMMRERYYLRPSIHYKEWIENDKEITPEKYQRVIEAFLYLRKRQEFVNICYQIIEELPEPTNYYAHFMLGCYLLKTYDESGLDHLFKAVELNNNIWDEAMQTIGKYALITGKHDVLEKCENKSRELTSEYDNVVSKMSYISPLDKLVTEELEGSMLDDFVAYIEKINNGVIERVYMVRKIIDSENFVSCVILDIEKNAESKKELEVTDGIFQYLDKTTSWQFSLFNSKDIQMDLIMQVKNSCIYEKSDKK